MNVDTKEPIEPTTVDHLLVLLITSEKIVRNKTYLFSFFLSSRAFISSYDLLMQLFEKNLCYILLPENYNKENMHKSLVKFIYIVKEWATYFPYDFREIAMAKAVEFVQAKCLAIDPSLKQDFNEIVTFLAREMRSLELYEEYLLKLQHEANKKQSKSMINTSILQVCYNPKELAIQLAFVEIDRISHIGPEEFLEYFMTLDSSYTKTTEPTGHDDKSDGCNKSFYEYLDELKKSCQSDIYIKKTNYQPATVRKSSNIQAYITWFNRLSSLVSTEIVKYSFDKAKRAEMITYFINAAFECFNMGNFNSTMAILSALNSFQVSRLTKTWKKVDKQKWDVLLKNTDPNNNYLTYRQIVRNMNERKAEEKDLIIIPVFSLVMKDLNFLFNSLPYNQFKGYLNLSKFWLMAKYISDNLLIKETRLNYREEPEVINYLLTEPTLSEDAASYSSFKCELPKNQNETNYYKKLRFKYS